MNTEKLSYFDGDAELEAFVAYDDSSNKPKPAVLIAHAWAGRSEFECEKAQMIAELGYVGFALDLYGKNILGQSIEENSQLMQPFMEDRNLLLKRMQLALSELKKHAAVDASNIVAMGYCFGGLCVLDLARSGTDISGVVSFHGLFTPPEGMAIHPITAKVLACHGYDDPMATPDQLTDFCNEMTAAQADWQVHAYGNTMHAFTNPEANDPEFGVLYNETADQRSEQALINFLGELFKA